MREAISLGVTASVIAGLSFGSVIAIEGVLSRAVGPINAAVIEHIAAGLLSAVVFAVIYLVGQPDLGAIRSATPLAFVAGTLVLVAVAGIAYAVPIINVTAANAGLLFGQTFIAIIIDTFGIGPYDPIPLSPTRILGIVLLAAGIYFVLPPSN